MKNTLLHQAAKFKLQNRKHKRWQKAVSILACIVVFCTVYALILPALTAEGTPHCGIEEHTHTDECYENRLICGKEEGEGAHTHTDECYTQEQTLICGLEEGEGAHTHTEECYDEDGNLICGLEENEGHQHTEECYQTENILTCDQEESEGHQHTAECYEQVLACGKEEHTHSLACYSDPNADVEDADTWQNSVSSVSLTGNWGSDLAAIAQTQIGYRESTSNYNVAEDGATMNGYTRYGAWAGDPYRDNWSAQFTDFCLSYAGIPSSAMVQPSDCWEWAPVSKEGYTPNTGDLIILDGNQDGTPDHAGIVLNANDAQVTTVIGDSDKEVKQNTYNLDNAIIVGYVTMPRNPNFDYGDAEPAADDADAQEPDNNNIEETPTAEPEETPEPAQAAEEDEDDAPEALDDETSFAGVTGKDGDAVVATGSDEQNMSVYVTGLTGEGTIYDPDGNLYSTKLKLDFNFSTEDIKNNGLDYYYEYPEGIIIPDELLNNEKTLEDDNNKTAGKRYFEKTSDGKYRLHIKFDSDYVKDAGTYITGHVFFSGKIDGTKGNQDGRIEIKGKDNVELVIPKENITYPENETNAYDISTTKSGSYEIKDGKLIYTVYVTSVKGTPDTILFEDTIVADNMKLGTPTVTVTKQTVDWYNKNNIQNTQNKGLITVTPSYSNGNLKMTLPKLEKAQNAGDYKVVNRYEVKYIYDVSGLAGKKPTAKNTVSASSTDNKTTVKSKSDCTVSINNEYTLNKYGWYDAANNRIKWTIDINSNMIDIANSKLSDDMLAQLAEGTAVTITPNIRYKINKDSQGKITGLEFLPDENGKNFNKYQIIYYTSVEAKWDSQVITNNAKFTPKEGEEINKDTSVTINGGGLEKTVGSGTIAENGKTIVIPWTSTITVPSSGLQKDTVISDDPTKDQYGNTGGEQWMTTEQIKSWADNIFWGDSNGNPISNNKIDLTDSNVANVVFKASDGNTYSYDDAIIKTDLIFTEWVVTLNQNLGVPEGAQKLIFKYKTTGNIENVGIGSTYFKNTIQVGDRKTDATYEYKKSGLIKTDENGNTDTTQKVNEDGTLRWKIKAYLSEACSTLTITDELPKGVKLVRIKGEGNIGEININVDGYGEIVHNNYYKVTGTYSGNKVEFTLGYSKYHADNGAKLNDKEYSFELNCKVDKDSIADYVSGQKYIFKNTASAKTDKGSIGNAEQTQEWTEEKKTVEEKVIDKTGKWNNDTRRVHYSIKLNPDGKDIVEGSDFLTLKDIFEYSPLVWAKKKGAEGEGTPYNVSAWLLADSVKLYKAVKNADGTLTKDSEITDWKWTVKTVEGATEAWKTNSSTIVAENLPDSTPMILEYDYQFQTDIPDGYESTNNMVVKNSATLEGTGYKDDKTQNDTKWANQEDGGGVKTDRNYTLYKVCKDDYGKKLSGAEFKLQKYSDSGYIDSGVTYITDADGKIVIKWQTKETDIQYEYNTLYRLIETKAPEGYVLPSAKQIEKNAIYFYFSSSDDSFVNNLPKDMPDNAYDITQASHRAYVENETEDVELEVKKKWMYTTAEGEIPTNAWEKEIKIDVYQQATTRNPDESVDESVTLDARFAGWQSITEKHPVGTIINVQVSKQGGAHWSPSKPSVKWDNSEATPIQTIEATAENEWTWTVSYQFKMTEQGNKLEVSDYAIGGGTTYSYQEPTPDEGKVIETCTLSPSNSWREIIKNLPRKGINDKEQEVYYVYYIKEHDVQEGVTVSYENNDGITYGTIIVTNKKEKPSDFVLPETGGIGTNRFTAVGLALMAGSLMCGYVMRRKRRERREI